MILSNAFERLDNDFRSNNSRSLFQIDDQSFEQLWRSSIIYCELFDAFVMGIFVQSKGKVIGLLKEPARVVRKSNESNPTFSGSKNRVKGCMRCRAVLNDN